MVTGTRNDPKLLPRCSSVISISYRNEHTLPTNEWRLPPLFPVKSKAVKSAIVIVYIVYCNGVFTVGNSAGIGTAKCKLTDLGRQ